MAMRIAVSGAHATGKSTLVAELGVRLPRYRCVEEAYYALEAEGDAFAEVPWAEDFERMLDHSLAALDAAPAGGVLFDRCPADYLAYLAALPEAGPETLARWIAPVAEALAGLDLVVFVPVERPDRIHVPPSEGRMLRKQVDALLREMLMDDAWGLAARTIEVRGTVEARARAVLARMMDRPDCIDDPPVIP